VILAGETAPSFSFQDMQRMAVAIAKSGLFGVKDADQALSLMLVASAEGKHPALIARDFDIIQGRPAKKADAILRDFQASGGKVLWKEMSDKRAAAEFSHPSSPAPVLIDWDMTRAATAGLAGKDMWKKYPRQMLRARVISEGCRAIAPGSTSGMYVPEEVQDFDPPAAEPLQINEAVAQAAATAISVPDPAEVEAFVNSMDVTNLPKLQEVFEEAWKSTKHAETRARYKSVYDAMKQEIATAQTKAAEFSEATS